MLFVLFFSLLTQASDTGLTPELKKQYDADLAFMAQIDGGSRSTPLHKTIFGDVAGANYQKFYNDRISKVKMGNCGDKFAIACVKAFSPRTIHLTDNFVKYSHPQIARAMVIYHETRHGESENGNWSHEKCPVPFLDPSGQPMRSIWSGAELAGKSACDKTPYGSYGSSVILLKNIQKFCKNCTEKVRQDAGLYADDNFGRIIDASARAEMIKDLYTK